MRLRLLLLAAFLACLTLVAIALKPRPPADGRIPLLWASSANPYRAAQVVRFNELHPHLFLKQDSSNNRFEKNIVQLSSGVGPDLYDAISGTSLQAYIESGVALDVTDEAAAAGLAAGTDTWPAIVNEITLGGRQYGYPANVSAQVCLYNKNVFDRFGVPHPAPGQPTWDEFFAMMRRVRGVPPGGGPHIEGVSAMDYSGRTPSVVFWKFVFQSRRGEFFTPDGLRPTVDTEDVRIAFEYHRDAIFRDKIHPAAAAMGSMTGSGAWGGGAIAQFAEGKFAVLITGKFALASLREFVVHQKKQLARWEADPELQRTQPKPEVLRLGGFMLPRFPNRPPGVVANAQTVVINPASPHRTQALEFLRFLATDTYAQMVMPYGLPANPQRVTYDFPATHVELAEHDVTRAVVASLAHGYQLRKSPFLLDIDIERTLAQQIARMEANPAMDIKALLAEAQADLEAMLQVNLRRDPKLAELYRQRVAAAARTK
jgi:ABC-type glycerol-3-phosphate transport system substrate-binding protein